MNKIQNTLWPVLTLSPFSPIYHWRKLLKSAVTHYIRIKSCCLIVSLNNIYPVFDGIIHQQVDGVAIGSPLGPSLANVFLAYYEQIWFNDCPDEFKPVYFKRYVDDIYVLF